MSMIEEIDKMMNSADLSFHYRIIDLGGKKLYIEGIRGVVDIGEREVIFAIKKGVITISGDKLTIKYLDKSTCIVAGEISSVVKR